MTYKRIRPCVNLPKSFPNVSIISYLCQQMRKAVLSIVATAVLLMGTLTLQAENYWQRAVVNYSRQQYRSGNQNWQVSQSWQGWMYFANNKGLLEFDGSNWQTYTLPGNPKVRAVRAEGDTIYVGALGQFGRFVRNQKGRLVYERLSDHLEKAGQLNVWHIHRIGHDTYYQSDDALYVNDGKNKITCPAGVSYSAVVYNQLYTVSSQGLFILSGHKFQQVQGVNINETSNIVSILPYGQGKLLLVSSDRGLFVYANHHIEPLHTAADALIRDERLSSGACSDDMIALGTMQNGVILLNLKTNTAEHLTIASGLQNKSVISTAFDRDQNLWLCLDNGIDCIPLRSPLRFLNSRQSPVGSGYCSIAYNGKLYLGTNQGLYEMTDNGIRFIEGTGSQVLCLDTIGGRLYCGGRRFFLSIDKDRITRYENRGVWGVRAIGRNDVLLTASYWGLRLMRRQGNDWLMAEEVKGTDISAKSFYVEDGTGGIWAANKEKGLFRITLSDDLKQINTEKCYNSDQLPKGSNVCIARIDGETVIATRQGLFRYNMTHDRVEPYPALENRLGGHAAYTYIHQHGNGDIWYAADGAIHLARGEHNEGYLNDWLMEDFENVSIAGGQAIIGTEEGFASLNLNQSPTSVKSDSVTHPYIRKVYIGQNADTLFYGCQQPAVIRWGDNAIRLEYSASNYDIAKSVQYSYRLEGPAEEDWSPYSHRRIKEYTNLPEGTYTFRLRVITAGSEQPEETEFHFTILPPWYRSWWAYLLYGLLLLALSGLAYRRLQESRLRLIAQKDEQIQEREEEIETLREEKLEIELRSKQDELVRSRMNIVRKNEMLQEIRKTAVSLNNAIPTDSEAKNAEALTTIRRRVTRLIGQIDTNIEHDDDLEAFKDSFDIIHNNFLQTLSERYPSLTHKEKMLCAYIRMNLLSKEIAPLLNISTRGVEISRYRIRQKLNLDTKESLTDFLQHI